MVTLLHENAADKKLTSKLEEASIHTADIVDLELEKKYERISIPAFTAQLLTRENFQYLLSQMQSYTTADAQVYFTLFIPWAEIAGELPEGEWYVDHEAKLDDGKETTALCKTKFGINRLHQKLSRKHQYTVTHPSGQKQQHRSNQELQWYSYPEIQLMLAASGWKVEKLITDLEPQEAAHPDAHILTIIASKI